MAILRRPKNIRALWPGAAFRMVFFVEASHRAYVKAEALLSDRRNYHALSSLLKAFLGGFI